MRCKLFLKINVVRTKKRVCNVCGLDTIIAEIFNVHDSIFRPLYVLESTKTLPYISINGLNIHLHYLQEEEIELKN